jgi:hypothetical protein
MTLLNRIGNVIDRWYSLTPWEQLKDWKRAYRVTYQEWQRALARCREQESFITVQHKIIQQQAAIIEGQRTVSNN